MEKARRYGTGATFALSAGRIGSGTLLLRSRWRLLRRDGLFAAARTVPLDLTISATVPARVCVVDEDFARYYWPHTSALASTFSQGGEATSDAQSFTIVWGRRLQ